MFNDKKLKIVSDAVLKIMEASMKEELKGNQHKIDANKNNKVDAHDFKLLRAGKKVAKEDVEQVDEISSELATKLQKGRARQAISSITSGDNSKAGQQIASAKTAKKYAELRKAQPTGNVTKKLFSKEDVEQVEEGIEDKLEAARAKAKAAGKIMKGPAKAEKSNVTKVAGKAYGGSAQKDDDENDEDDEPKKASKKGVFKRRYNTKVYKEQFSHLLDSYINGGLKSVMEDLEVVEVDEEVDNETFTKEVEAQKAKAAGKGKKADIAAASVQAVTKEEVEQIDEIHVPGTKVKVPHMGKMVSGKVIRHDKGEKHGSPFYVVDVGTYESPKVPAHQVQKEEVEEVDMDVLEEGILDLLNKARKSVYKTADEVQHDHISKNTHEVEKVLSSLKAVHSHLTVKGGSKAGSHIVDAHYYLKRHKQEPENVEHTKNLVNSIQAAHRDIARKKENSKNVRKTGPRVSTSGLSEEVEQIEEISNRKVKAVRKGREKQWNSQFKDGDYRKGKVVQDPTDDMVDKFNKLNVKRNLRTGSNIKNIEQVEQIEEISKSTYVGAMQTLSDPDTDRGHHDTDDKLISRAKKQHGEKFAKDLQGVYKMHWPRANQADGRDKLKSSAAVRTTQSGKANKQDVKTKSKEIQSRLGTHKKSNLPEQFNVWRSNKGDK